MTIFNDYARYYDLIYQDKDYAAEADYVTSLLSRFDSHARHLLEFGSGTGVHGRLLAEHGYHVLGLDSSSEMILQARRSIRSDAAQLHQGKKGTRNGSFDCREGDIRQTQIKDSFDAVLALYHVISYMVTNADVIATFNNAHRHLKTGGYFLFDIWYSPAVLAQRPEVRIKRVEDEQVKIVRLAEPVIHPNQNLVDVNYTLNAEEIATHRLTTIQETHHMRHYSLPELELLAGFTGFSLLHSEEFLTGEKPSEKTWGVCCVLRKEG